MGSGGGATGTAKKILTVFGSGSVVIANQVDPVTGASISTPWQDQTEDAIGLAADDSGTAVGLLRSKTTGELRYAFYGDGAWTPGASGTPTTLEPGLTSASGPSVAADGATAHGAFRGKDGKYYYARVQNKSWSSKAEAITAGGQQSSGPNPPAVAAIGMTPVIAFVGADGVFYDQSRSGGAWSPATAHPFAGKAASVTPAIAALDAGPELVAVFVEAGANGLYWLARKAGTWTAPTPITGAASTESPSLAPLPGGGAILAYRGTDQRLYTARLATGDAPTWTAPSAGAGGASPFLSGAPAVAKGAIGAEAELVYVDNLSSVYSSRLVNGAWSAPKFAGSASGRVAITTVP